MHLGLYLALDRLDDHILTVTIALELSIAKLDAHCASGVLRLIARYTHSIVRVNVISAKLTRFHASQFAGY